MSAHTNSNIYIYRKKESKKKEERKNERVNDLANKQSNIFETNSTQAE